MDSHSDVMAQILEELQSLNEHVSELNRKISDMMNGKEDNASFHVPDILSGELDDELAAVLRGEPLTESAYIKLSTSAYVAGLKKGFAITREQGAKYNPVGGKEDV